MAISNSQARTDKVTNPDGTPPGRKPRLNFGRFSVPVPASRALRITLGILLCLGGLLWFLPILGLWMLPLGILLLSIDLAPVRRVRRRTEIWWGRRKQNKSKT
jgi:hypothetical protein